MPSRNPPSRDGSSTGMPTRRQYVNAVPPRFEAASRQATFIPSIAGSVIETVVPLSLYLTFVEAREQQMDKRHTAWWLQLTFLLHFAGYLALRGWTFYRRRHSTA